MTNEVHKELEESRKERQKIFHEGVNSWINATMELAEDLAKKTNKTPRQVLDVLFNPRLLRAKSAKTSPFSAWSWKIAQEERVKRTFDDTNLLTGEPTFCFPWTWPMLRFSLQRHQLVQSV